MKKSISIIFLILSLITAYYIYAETVSDDSASKWKNTNYPVKSPYEQEYDADSSGFLEPSESQQLLKSKYEMIKTVGETGVDSDLLREYDANSNGSIDAREAQEIYNDIQ